MKHLNLVVILFLAASINLFAQDNTTTASKSKLSLYLSGSTNFSQHSSLGGNVGARYFMLPNLALRGGFSISSMGNGFRPPRHDEEFGGEHNINNSQMDPVEMQNEMNGMDRRHGSTSVGANVYALIYPYSISDFSFYAGAGGIFNYNLTKVRILNPDGTVLNTIPREGRFGYGAVVGTEYKLNNKFNVSFEYNPTFMLGHRGEGNGNASKFNLGVVYNIK